MLSYSSSVMCEKSTAGSSTLTPISTRFDSVSMPSSSHTVSIHLLPLLPTETMHLLQVYSPPSVTTLYPPSVRPMAFTGVRNLNSTLSFSSSYRFSSTI